jgi:hypothetical protein
MSMAYNAGRGDFVVALGASLSCAATADRPRLRPAYSPNARSPGSTSAPSGRRGQRRVGVLAEATSQLLPQPMVVVNKSGAAGTMSGAAGTIGLAEGANAKSDGCGERGRHHPGPDRHFKFPHLSTPKLLQAGRGSDY